MAKKAPDRKRISADVKRRQISPRKESSKGKGGKGKGSKARQARQAQEITTEDLKVEYSYVLKDLRRIFILAGVMFVLLITANILYPIFFA